MAHELVVHVMKSKTITNIDQEIAQQEFFSVDEKKKLATLRKRNIAVNHYALPFATFLYRNELERLARETNEYVQNVKDKIPSIVLNSCDLIQEEEETLSSNDYFNAVVMPQLNAVKADQAAAYAEEENVIRNFIESTINKYKDCFQNLADPLNTPAEKQKASADAIKQINKIKKETEKDLQEFEKAGFLLAKSPECQIVFRELKQVHTEALATIEKLKNHAGNDIQCKNDQANFASEADKSLTTLDEGFERIREAQKDQIEQFNLMLREELKKNWHTLLPAVQATASNNLDKQEEGKTKIKATLEQAVKTTQQQHISNLKAAWSMAPLVEESESVNAASQEDNVNAGLKKYPPQITTGFEPNLVSDPDVTADPELRKLETAKKHVQKNDVTVDYKVGWGAVIRCKRNSEGNLSFSVKDWGWGPTDDVIFKMTDIMTSIYGNELSNVPITISSRDPADASKCQGSLAARGVNIPPEIIVDKPSFIKGFLNNIVETTKKVTGAKRGMSKEEFKPKHTPEFYEAKMDSMERAVKESGQHPDTQDLLRDDIRSGPRR
jgi:hypothetical protein